jgi:ferritin-like metal-binding protein YciE
MTGIFRDMAKTKTARELLIVALQDLFDAEQAVIERAPTFETDVSRGLAGYLAEERERARTQSARLKGCLDALDAPATDAPNIWLRAALDDAARDYETIAPGNLRDIALVGAFRKAKQSERVSYETAVGLARSVAEPDMEAGLLICRNEEAAADESLAQLLGDLLSKVGVSPPRADAAK